MAHAWLVFCVLLSLLSPVANAATYYVAPAGSDAVSCATALTISTPRQTIAGGVNCLSAGDTLSIRSGTYTPTATVTVSVQGTVSQPVTITGHPGDPRPVIQPTSGASSAAFLVHSNASTAPPSYLTIKDLDINGINMASGTGCIAVYMPNTTLENIYCVNAACTGFALAGYFEDANSDNIIVRNTHIKDCGRLQSSALLATTGYGMVVWSASGLIEDNLIDGCRAGGISLEYAAASSTVVRANVVRNAGTSSPWGAISSVWDGGTGRPTTARGIAIGGAGTFGLSGPSNNQIYNNILARIVGTAGAGQCLYLWGATGTFLAHNTCVTARQPYVAACGSSNPSTTLQNHLFAGLDTDTPTLCGTLTGTVSHNVFTSLLFATFANPSTDDFHLRPYSPAWNTGITLGAVPDDFEAVARPVGVASDIGAYEFEGLPSCGGITPRSVPRPGVNVALLPRPDALIARYAGPCR